MKIIRQLEAKDFTVDGWKKLLSKLNYEDLDGTAYEIAYSILVEDVDEFLENPIITFDKNDNPLHLSEVAKIFNLQPDDLKNFIKLLQDNDEDETDVKWKNVDEALASLTEEDEGKEKVRAFDGDDFEYYISDEKFSFSDYNKVTVTKHPNGTVDIHCE